LNQKKKSKINYPKNYSKIKAKFRQTWMWYDEERKKALEKASACRGQKICASCQHSYPTKEVEVHHKTRVVSKRKGFEGWGKLVDRMFCKANKLVVLCRKCHKEIGK